MKVFLFVILLTSAIYSQKMDTGLDYSCEKDKSYYQLTGIVRKVDVERNPNLTTFNLTISFELKNVSDKNLLLWKRNDFLNATYKDIPLLVGKKFSVSSRFSEADIVFTDYAGPSNDFSDEWTNLRNILNKEEPPNELILTLKPNESWRFDWKVSLTGYKDNRNDKLQYSKLKEFSLIWLKTYHEVWSFNIEPKATDRSTKLVFGKMLQKRWNNYGYLLLDDIVSEPITLDLSSAMIKTDFQLE